jgi:hypothetical protein
MTYWLPSEPSYPPVIGCTIHRALQNPVVVWVGGDDFQSGRSFNQPGDVPERLAA